MNADRHFRSVLCVWAWLALAAGCASFDLPDPPVGDVAQKRQQRAEEVVLEFESKRDLAEMQAAMTHWNQGEVEACELELRRLLKRNPDHRQARLLMAKVRRTDGPPRAALDQVEETPLEAAGPCGGASGMSLRREGNGDLDLYERATELEADETVTTVAHQTAPPAAEQVEPFPSGPTGQSGDSPRTSAETTFVVPDPTAYPVKSASTPAVKRPNRPSVAAGPDDTSQAPTTPDRASQKETSDHVDPADPAETTEKDRLSVRSRKGRQTLAEGSDQAAPLHSRKTARHPAEAIRPDNPQIPIAAALEALRRDRPDLAVELLRSAERRFSGTDSTQTSAQLHRILGVAFYRLGDYQSSQVALRQALSLDKSSALSYFLMGCTLSKLGHLESAEAHFRQARAINPRYTVGW